MRITKLALVVFLALGSGGCAEQFSAVELGLPVSMGEAAGTTVAAQPFRIRTKSVHLLWGILPLSRSSLADAVSHQVIDANTISNVRIRVSSRWSDFLVMALTAGVIVPRTVTYEGVAARTR